MVEARHQGAEFDIGRQFLVRERDLELVLEVGDGAQTAHHDLGAHVTGEIDSETAIRQHLNVREVAYGFGEQGDAFGGVEQQLLVGAIVDGDDEVVPN